MDTVEPKSPIIYQPETFGQSSNRYRSCVHSDCKTDSKNSPKLNFARFVLPKQDPIRAQRWVEMLCRKDFGLKDIRPHTILCELHFTNEANLDHRTNLSLEPKPHRSCPPGFAPKANPVPNEWIDAALRNRENPFREKVLECVEQQKAKIVKFPEPKKSETSNEIIVSQSPESKDQESSETSNQSEIVNLQNDERPNNDKNKKNAQKDHVQDNNVKGECLENNDKEVKNIQEQHIQNVLCAEKECASKDLVQDKHIIKNDITEESSQVKYVQEKSVQENNPQGECLKVKQVKHVKKKPLKRQLAQWKDVAQRNAEIQLQLKSLQGKTQGKTRVWLPCDICSRVYQSREELKDHIRVHEKEKRKISDPFKCWNCSFSFSSKFLLNRHAEAVHEGKKHQCGQCNAYFPNIYNLKTHISNVHERKNPTKENTFQGFNHFKCKICEANFFAIGGLNNHMARNHRTETIFSVKCNICGEFYKNHIDLKRHNESVHEQKSSSEQNIGSIITSQPEPVNVQNYACNICGESYSSDMDYKIHMSAVHGVKRPFRCAKCDCSYPTLSGMKKHAGIHEIKYDKFNNPICPNALEMNNDFEKQLFEKAGQIHLPKLEIKRCDDAERFVKVKKVLNFDNQSGERRCQESEVVELGMHLGMHAPANGVEDKRVQYKMVKNKIVQHDILENELNDIVKRVTKNHNQKLNIYESQAQENQIKSNHMQDDYVQENCVQENQTQENGIEVDHMHKKNVPEKSTQENHLQINHIEENSVEMQVVQSIEPQIVKVDPMSLDSKHLMKSEEILHDRNTENNRIEKITNEKPFAIIAYNSPKIDQPKKRRLEQQPETPRKVQVIIRSVSPSSLDNQDAQYNRDQDIKDEKVQTQNAPDTVQEYALKTIKGNVNYIQEMHVQEEIVQIEDDLEFDDQIVQDQNVQDQNVLYQIVREQILREQIAQDKNVHDLNVQDQIVQDQNIQDQNSYDLHQSVKEQNVLENCIEDQICQKSNTQENYQCGHCNACFPNEYILKTHITNVHERRNHSEENIEFHHEQTQGKLVGKNSQEDLEKTKNEQLAEINGKENYLCTDKGTQLISSRPRKTYSRRSHCSKKDENKTNAKLKLLKKFLDKPTTELESDVCTNHNGAKLTNQILRKTLSDLLQVQYDIR